MDDTLSGVLRVSAHRLETDRNAGKPWAQVPSTKEMVEAVAMGIMAAGIFMKIHETFFMDLAFRTALAEQERRNDGKA